MILFEKGLGVHSARLAFICEGMGAHTVRLAFLRDWHIYIVRSCEILFEKGWVLTPSGWHMFEKGWVLTPSGWHIYIFFFWRKSPFLKFPVNNMHPSVGKYRLLISYKCGQLINKLRLTKFRLAVT